MYINILVKFILIIFFILIILLIFINIIKIKNLNFFNKEFNLIKDKFYDLIQNFIILFFLIK